MIAPARRGALVAAVAISVGAVPVRAQPVVPGNPSRTLDCREPSVVTLTPAQIGNDWLRFHPRRLRLQIQPLLDAGGWEEAMDSVVAAAREALLFAPPEALDRYQNELATTVRLFGRLVALPVAAQARFRADSVQPTRWQVTENPVTGSMAVFAGPGELAITDSMSSAERRALCWPAISIHALLTLQGADDRDRTVDVLNELAARWDDYIDESYSQLPWELAVNSLGRSRRNWEPPAGQWVLLHPSVGIEVAGLRRRDLARVDVAVLEAAGYMRYFAGYSRRLGVTAVATFARDRAMALGAYAHLWFPQAKVGYVVRPDSAGREQRSLLVSVDLYGLLTGVPRNLREAKDAALERFRSARPPR